MRQACWMRLGAGEGNRTLVFSLEGCCSTIELHPRLGAPYHGPAAVSTVQGAGFWAASGRCAQGRFRAGHPPLNSGGISAYIDVFRNQRKEVIQCLLPSAVTSLGSPAKL